MKCLFTAIICFLFISGKAQLANTSWTGMSDLLMEDHSLKPVKTTSIFGKDTLQVLIEGYSTELLTYTINKDIITLTKVSGGSPCQIGTWVKEKYQIKGDKIFFHDAESHCEAYLKGMDGKSYDRVK
jgi:hypothetical protein